MDRQHRSDDELLARMSRGIWELDCLPSFRTGLLAALRDLIGCDIASYNEIGASPGEVFVVADPMDSLRAHPALDAFAEFVHQNPLAAHYIHTEDTQARRLSDFISSRDLHALDLYDLVYRHTGIEHQLAFTVPNEGQLIGITVSRSGRDFDERELGLLERSRGMIVAAFRSLHDRARLQVAGLALDRVQDAAPAIVMVEASGLLQPLHERAERVLRDLAREPHQMEALRQWARVQRRTRTSPNPVPLQLQSGASLLEAHYVHGQPGAVDAIALRQVAIQVTHALRAMGLTRRQADVLELIWKGSTNAEVALALRISEHTVRHHLEDIYRRLGVRTRAAASHMVTEMLSLSGSGSALG
jgi:DNA-binding CsgD family transcriptional regulator